MPTFSPRLNLSHKLIIAFILLGLIPLAVGFFFSYRVQKATIEDTMGSAFQGLARETGIKLGILLDDLLDRSKRLAQSHELAESAFQADKRYVGLTRTEIDELLSTKSAGWSVQSALGNMDRSAVRVLDEFRERDPLEYHLLMLTDREGGVIAASPTTAVARFNHRADPEWQGAFAGGEGSLYLGDINWEPELSAYTLNAAVPVRRDGQFVGMLLVIHRVDRLFTSVTNVRIGKTDHTMLANSDGALLFCPIFQIRNHTLSRTLSSELFQNRDGWNVTTADVHYPGREAINGFAPVSLTTPGLSLASLGGRQWYIFTSQSPDETFGPLHTLRRWTSLSAGMGLLLLVFFATLVIRKIVHPIVQLQGRARQISHAIQSLPMNQTSPTPLELSNLRIRTGDEIEDLAGLFSEMARVLKSTRELLAATTKRLEEMAITDELTGLNNRRHVFEQLRAEYSRSVRFNLPLSVIAIDIDYFKNINDQYGHPSGDDALRQFANILRRNFREPDLLARTGGEEFLAVLPQTDRKGAQSKADWLRRQVEEYEFAVGQGRLIRMTVSLGVAAYPDNRFSDMTDLLKFADQALYRAKQGGRNRVEV